MEDVRHGWAVGENGIILKYNGVAWSIQDSVTPNTLYSVFFTDTSYGWAAGEHGTILYTRNGDEKAVRNELSVVHGTDNAMHIRPNPFMGSAVLSFRILQKSKVSLDLLNVSGQFLLRVFNGNLNGGMHSFEISGRHLSPGMYLCRLLISEKSYTSPVYFLK
jgi:hypothetical protein